MGFDFRRGALCSALMLSEHDFGLEGSEKSSESICLHVFLHCCSHGTLSSINV
jgi:hypothetical protein